MSSLKRYNSAYHIISLLKLIVGLVVLVVVYQYIDPFQDPETGIIIGSIGLLFFIRGLSYFVFYTAGLRWSDNKIQLIMSHAYKLSLLVALFFITNIVFLVIEFRTFTNSLIILLIFGSLYWILFHRPLPEQHTSIDMIVEGKANASEQKLTDAKAKAKANEDEYNEFEEIKESGVGDDGESGEEIHLDEGDREVETKDQEEGAEVSSEYGEEESDDYEVAKEGPSVRQIEPA